MQVVISRRYSIGAFDEFKHLVWMGFDIIEERWGGSVNDNWHGKHFWKFVAYILFDIRHRILFGCSSFFPLCYELFYVGVRLVYPQWRLRTMYVIDLELSHFRSSIFVSNEFNNRKERQSCASQCLVRLLIDRYKSYLFTQLLFV